MPGHFCQSRPRRQFDSTHNYNKKHASAITNRPSRSHNSLVGLAISAMVVGMIVVVVVVVGLVAVVVVVVAEACVAVVAVEAACSGA